MDLEAAGIAADAKQGMEWVHKAAEQGLVKAQALLGGIYFAGRGTIPRDHKQALKWLHKAAEQGDALAQTTLGELYEQNSEDVKQDWQKAFYWHSLAELVNPMPRSQAHRDAAAAHLSPEQLAEVNLLIDQWKTTAKMDKKLGQK